MLYNETINAPVSTNRHGGVLHAFSTYFIALLWQENYQELLSFLHHLLHVQPI